MIIRLLPEQISELWDSIRYGIINAIAPLIDPTPDNIQDIFCKLITQDIQCWCIYGEDKEIYGYVTTTISVNIDTKFRTLVIYSLYLYKKPTSTMWDTGMSALEKYAKANKCTRIIAYTDNPAVLAITKKYGYSDNFRYIIKDIGE